VILPLHPFLKQEVKYARKTILKGTSASSLPTSFTPIEMPKALIEFSYIKHQPDILVNAGVRYLVGKGNLRFL